MAEKEAGETSQKTKKASKKKDVLTIQSDTLLSDPYLRQHVESTQFIYGLLYPDARIMYVFLKHDGFGGQRDATRVEAYNPVAPFVANDNLAPESTLVQRMTDHYGADLMWFTISGGRSDEDPRLVVTVRVPRDAKGLPLADRTHLEFSNKVNIVANRLPLVFEVAKFLFENKAKGDRLKKHNHSPVARQSAERPNDLSKRDRSKRPSIVIGLHWLETGGAEKLGFDSVQWALDAGLRVFVVSDQSAPQRLAYKLPSHPDVQFIRLDAYLLPGWEYNFMAKLIRRENVCAIHLHHHAQLYELLLKLKLLFPDLMVIDSTHIIEHQNGGFPRISGVWTNYIDVHHVISNELVTYYRDEFEVSDKVRLGRMLEPHDWVQPLDLAEASLQPGQKTCRLIFVGRMVHQKRAPIMVEVARKLNGWAKKNSIELKVDMVGTGAYRDNVSAMIRRAKLDQVITLHNADADVPSLMKSADILVVPSSNEGLALVCYEAIENGTIPISTDVGGQSELVPADLLTRNPVNQCVADTVALVQRLMTDADFLDKCKAEIQFCYQDLRRDPTAQVVLGEIYTHILNSAPKPARKKGRSKT